MSIVVLTIFVVACAAVMVAERAGVPTTLDLQFKGDLKRESRWFAQYGQFAATAIAAILVFQIDSRGLRRAVALIVAVGGTSIVCAILKRLLGRVRPGRENAGRFLGPALGHANYRESFPSSHSACAVAMTVMLAGFYPPAAITFWVLAAITALLRYLMDAHWPSDVLGGIALGYAIAHGTLAVLASGRWG